MTSAPLLIGARNVGRDLIRCLVRRRPAAAGCQRQCHDEQARCASHDQAIVPLVALVRSNDLRTRVRWLRGVLLESKLSACAEGFAQGTTYANLEIPLDEGS